MKIKFSFLILIVAILALAFTFPIRAQSTNTAIVIAPVSQTVLQPATGTLTAAQVTALKAALAGGGITFSGGYVANVNLHLTFKLAPSGTYTVTFYPAAPTN